MNIDTIINDSIQFMVNNHKTTLKSKHIQSTIETLYPVQFPTTNLIGTYLLNKFTETKGPAGKPVTYKLIENQIRNHPSFVGHGFKLSKCTIVYLCSV